MKSIFFAPLFVTLLLIAILVPAIASGETKSVTIEWSLGDTTNVTGYKMYYSYSNDPSSLMLACETNDPTVTSLTCTGLDITTSPIYFAIAAVTEIGEKFSVIESPISPVQNFSLFSTSSM